MHRGCPVRDRDLGVTGRASVRLLEGSTLRLSWSGIPGVASPGVES